MSNTTSDLPVFAFLLALALAIALIIAGMMFIIFQNDVDTGLKLAAIGATFGLAVLIIVIFGSNTIELFKSWW
jgi:hypothetical protein